MTRSNNEIPVRRREGGVPWWAWLIGLALLALALLFLTGVLGGNNNNAGASPTVPVTSPQGGGTSPETSPDAGGTSPDAGGASPDASPASSWTGPDRLTVVIPARLNAA